VRMLELRENGVGIMGLCGAMSDSSLSSGQLGDWHTVRTAGYVVEANAVAKVHTVRVPSVLTCQEGDEKKERKGERAKRKGKREKRKGDREKEKK
jgi:hypothetical protein